MSNTNCCPLCGGPNDCGVALGKDNCWCFSTPVPPEVLARVPEDQRNVACVCQKCVESASPHAKPLESPRLTEEGALPEVSE